MESSRRIDTYIDVVVESLELQSSVNFEFCIDEEFIEFWLADLMFEIPHATNFCRKYSFQWCILIVRQDHSGMILGLWRILLF